jgi:hypothetical protein
MKKGEVTANFNEWKLHRSGLGTCTRMPLQDHFGLILKIAS